jgi:hypothetical protein
MATLTFGYNPLHRSTTITTFDTFPAVRDNILKLCNILRRHGQIVRGEEELGEGILRAHYNGRGFRRPLPARLLSISILLVELLMPYARVKGLEWGET